MNTIVFAFARMSPPTTGHQRLITTLVETAKIYQADHVVYISQTHDTKTNPLDWNFKRRVCESAFRGVNISNDKSIKNPYLALEHLSENYNKIILVAGSDRLESYNSFAEYANDWNIEFEMISAGDRIVESNGVEGMSASKMRQYALEKNKEKFFEGLPTTLNKNVKELVYQNTRKGMIKS